MSWLARPGLLLLLVKHVRLAVRLVREPRVPVLTKTLPLAAALYVVLPVDVVPDVLPVLGQLDDLGVALAAAEAFIRLCPQAATAFHREAIARGRRFSRMPAADDFIDASWRRE
jgi:uncharacterized membrane protein YkvA (DUF1232 family)